MKAFSIPEYLKSECQDVCYGCSDAVKQNPETGRWFITMRHPGFNAPANNYGGYRTRTAALRSLQHYGSKRLHGVGIIGRGR